MKSATLRQPIEGGKATANLGYQGWSRLWVFGWIPDE